MIHHSDFNNDPGRTKLLRLIRQKKILFGGNESLKIFGLLSCKSGKRMKTSNRVFFKSVEEANLLGYRPCGHCMHQEYIEWKKTRDSFLSAYVASRPLAMDSPR